MLRGMWDLPRPGLEPVSPALAGRFSTTVPPGKPDFNSFKCVKVCVMAQNKIFLNVPFALEKNIQPAVTGWSVLIMSIKSVG